MGKVSGIVLTGWARVGGAGERCAWCGVDMDRGYMLPRTAPAALLTPYVCSVHCAAELLAVDAEALAVRVGPFTRAIARHELDVDGALLGLLAADMQMYPQARAAAAWGAGR